MAQPGYTPKVATRPVLRIFISSTAVDLLDYRDKVRDAGLRFEGLPIANRRIRQVRTVWEDGAARSLLPDPLWSLDLL